MSISMSRHKGIIKPIHNHSKNVLEINFKHEIIKMFQNRSKNFTCA